MNLCTLGIFALSVQCFMSGCSSDVNNVIKGKILFSNQNLVEKNEEVIHTGKKTVLSRAEIFGQLSSIVSVEEMSKEKLKELVELLSATELRHIEFLIYLIGYYRFAAPFIIKVIKEVLLEDERILEDLLRNIGLNLTALPPS